MPLIVMKKTRVVLI